MGLIMLRTCPSSKLIAFFFFNDTATTEIYTLSLHDALPISHHEERPVRLLRDVLGLERLGEARPAGAGLEFVDRSEEHTSELQSPCNLVCRLLLEKKITVLADNHECAVFVD